MFGQEVKDAICARLAEGESLRAICSEEGMPSESLVRKWALTDAEFGAQYARARDLGLEALADEIIHISNTPVRGVKTKTGDDGKVETTEGDMIEHRRLQVDARKWYLSKLAPKKYGDKLTTEHTGPGGGPMQANVNLTLTPEEAYKRMLNGV